MEGDSLEERLDVLGSVDVGRPGEAPAVIGNDLVQGLEGARVSVPDGVGLVEDDALPHHVQHGPCCSVPNPLLRGLLLLLLALGGFNLQRQSLVCLSVGGREREREREGERGREREESAKQKRARARAGGRLTVITMLTLSSESRKWSTFLLGPW